MANAHDSGNATSCDTAGPLPSRTTGDDPAIVQASDAGAQQEPIGHFLAHLGVTFTYDSTGAQGSTSIRSTLFAPGTTTLRTGLLVAMQDLLSGYMSGEPAGPTVDLRLRVLHRPPTVGLVRVAVRPLRVGRRIIVGEAVIADEDGRSFACGVSTFLRLHGGSKFEQRANAVMHESSFDDMLGVAIVDRLTLEFTPEPRHRNNNQAAAVQGGLQALLAEMCAEHALGDGRRMTATDIDIRYLNSLRSTKIVARAKTLVTRADGGLCTVSLTDGDDSERIVSHVTLTMRFTD